MSKSKIVRTDLSPPRHELAAALERFISLEPGASATHAFTDGENLVEITVTVRRKTTPAAERLILADAITRLEADPNRAERCECSTTQKQLFSRAMRVCRSLPTHVVAYTRPGWTAGPGITILKFTCALHADIYAREGVHARDLVGVARIPADDLHRVRALLVTSTVSTS
jgi:hypothetical protein